MADDSLQVCCVHLHELNRDMTDMLQGLLHLQIPAVGYLFLDNHNENTEMVEEELILIFQNNIKKGAGHNTENHKDG